MNKKFKVTGMSCAACSARVEKAVGGLDGVSSCSVNLLAGSMSVESELSDSEIIAAVKKAGYGAESLSGDSSRSLKEEPNAQKRPVLIRLIASVALLIPLMYVSMGHVMLSLPLPEFLSEFPVSVALTEMLLAGLILVINQRFFINGAKGIVSGAPNMDTLVSLGSGVSFIYSTFMIFVMVSDGSGDLAHYLHGLYFESAAMILTLITVGKMLEERAKGKTTSAVKELMDLSPKTAVVERDGVELTIPSSEVRVGDIFILRSGDAVAVDGVIVEGELSLVESALTGESVPVDKGVGDKVFAATVNSTGFAKCKATSVGSDTAISGVVKLVEEAAATKAPISKIADKVSGVFVPIIIGLSALTFIIWCIVSGDVGYSIGRGISVLVISCPCALGLATPVAIMVGSGVGAKNGILYKTAESIELTGKAKTVVLDKTGTVTRGVPEVVGAYAANGVKEEELLCFAYSVEEKSEHPQARAITDYCRGRVLKKEVSSFKTVAGSGVLSEIEGETVVGGNLRFVSQYCTIDTELISLAEQLSDSGKTPMFFAKGDRALGIIATADGIREDSGAAIGEFKKLGLSVVLLTGDNSRVGEAVGRAIGVDKVISEVMPDGKSDAIKELSRDGGVIMIGDGINDAPALTVADVGMAIGGGTDVAIESADVVLVRDTLADAVAAVKLGRRVLKNIHENLFFAFVYNLIGIPMAAGLFGFALSPMFGALAMSLSSFSVVSNALRINTFVNKSLQNKANLNKTEVENGASNNENYNEKGEEKMKTLIKVEGMMCPHCEARVREAILLVDGVESAEVSHKSGEALVVGNADGTVLCEAIRKVGYNAEISS